MNIYFFVYNFYPYGKGAENQAYILAKELVSQGYNITVITRNFPGLKKNEYLDGFNVKRLSVFGSDHIAGLTYIFSLLFFLIFNAKKADIYQVFIIGITAFILIPFKIIYKKKLIIKTGAKLKEGDFGLLQKTFLGNLKLRFIKKYTDIFIAVSKELSNDLLSENISIKKTIYIPTGIDTDYFYPVSTDKKIKLRETSGYQKNSDIILFVGRLTYQKNVETLIKAVGLIKEKTNNLKVLIIGNGELKEYLNKLSVSLKINNYIDFLGEKKNIINYYAISDIFCLPSHFEGLSNALIEAQAMGIPAVVSNIGGNIDIIKDNENGFVFDKENFNELADKLIYLLQNENLRKKMSEKARVNVLNLFSKKQLVDNYIVLYDKLLSLKPDIHLIM